MMRNINDGAQTDSGSGKQNGILQISQDKIAFGRFQNRKKLQFRDMIMEHFGHPKSLPDLYLQVWERFWSKNWNSRTQDRPQQDMGAQPLSNPSSQPWLAGWLVAERFEFWSKRSPRPIKHAVAKHFDAQNVVLCVSKCYATACFIGLNHFSASFWSHRKTTLRRKTLLCKHISNRSAKKRCFAHLKILRYGMFYRSGPLFGRKKCISKNHATMKNVTMQAYMKS